MIIIKDKFEVWFITGSQYLYGEESLKQVDNHSKEIVNYFNSEGIFPADIIWKPVLKNSSEIKNVISEANSKSNCIGLIGWMHTFSPAKMWIAGLKIMDKPFMHLHTQFDESIPWDTLDMDYMNTNQSAHGGREFGFISTRMKLKRKVVTGYWRDKNVIKKIENWIRAAMGWNESQNLKLARFGDNMRNVAVTEGNKVDAQIDLGYEVHGYGVGDLLKYVNRVEENDIENLIKVYGEEYPVTKSSVSDERFKKSLHEAA
ncbi:MAG: L-arabinose isomerase, partial [Kosmotogales bacterium]|nr:L-arabinose isomerase [Kosmotogales bacterium]